MSSNPTRILAFPLDLARSIKISIGLSELVSRSRVQVKHAESCKGGEVVLIQQSPTLMKRLAMSAFVVVLTLGVLSPTTMYHLTIAD